MSSLGAETCRTPTSHALRRASSTRCALVRVRAGGHMSACHASVSSMQPRTADERAVSAMWLSSGNSHGCVVQTGRQLQHDRSLCAVQGYTNGVPNSNSGRRLLQAATRPYDSTTLDQCQAKVDTLVAPYMVRRCGVHACIGNCMGNHGQHQLTPRNVSAPHSMTRSCTQAVNTSIQTFSKAVSGPASTLDSVTNAIDPIVSDIEGALRKLVDT